MSELDYLTAVLLGIIQGATEFLPISSSGHLALVQQWLDLDAAGPTMLLFDVFVHVGTLIAVGIVFFDTFGRFLNRLKRESTSSWSGRRVAWRMVWLAVAASIPTAIIGLAFQDDLEAAFGRPALIASCLGVTGVMLAILGWRRRGRRGWRDFALWEALVIGIVQGLAILPGISRSGATICTACYCGWRRRWAAQFSFLIAVPAILGGTLLKLKDTLELPAEGLRAVPWGPIVIGAIVSTIVGVAALRLLLKAVDRAKLHYFAVYCWLIAGVVFLMGS